MCKFGKKFLSVIGVLLLVVVVAEAKTDKVVFHLNHFMSPMHPIHVNMLEPMSQEVKEKTEGRVEIVIHPGSALAAPPNCYDAVVSGVAGMGFVLPAYTPGRFPLSQTLEYPFLFTSALQANLTARDIMPLLQEQEYADTKLLWFGGTDLGHFLLKKEVKTLDDLKGMKLRSPGPIYNDVIRAIGGVEVSLPVSDLYDAMDRGVVDGTVMAPSALLSFKLIEVTNQIVMLNMYTTPLILFANKDLWNKVSPEDQQIIMDITDTFPERIGRQYDVEVEHGMSEARKAGKDIFTFSDADMAAFHAAVDPLIKKWIADLEAVGKPGQQVYDLVIEGAKKYAQ